MIVLVVYYKNGEMESFPWHSHTSSEVLLAWLGAGMIDRIEIKWLD